MKVYLIGSLRNVEVPNTAKFIREAVGCEVFDDWHCAGPEADDYWQKYEKARGHSFDEALYGHAAQHVFNYDKSHLDSSDVGVLMLPAGKSGHLEAGYLIGQHKPVYIIGPEPERFDVMYNFAKRFLTDLNELCAALRIEQYSISRKFVVWPTFAAGKVSPFLTFTPTADPMTLLPTTPLDSPMPPITNFEGYDIHVDTPFKKDHLPEGSS